MRPGADIIASEVQFTPKEILATFAIKATAQGGDHAIKVKIGNLEHGVNFFVQIPTRVAVESESSITQCDPTPCTIQGKPNSCGDPYKMIASVVNSNANQGEATSFFFLISPDLGNTRSEFVVHQCGDFDKDTNPNGFISGQALSSNAFRHEAGNSRSHYINYKFAQDN